MTDYTVKALAKRLRVCEEMPRRWLRDGRLFAEKRNGRYYIPAADAQLFIEAYERTRRRGKALAAEPPTNTRGNYRTSKVSRATTTQGLYVGARSGGARGARCDAAAAGRGAEPVGAHQRDSQESIEGGVVKTASPWKQVAEYVMHRDATGGATIPHTDGHGTTLVSADGIAHAIDHARIIDRYLEALEAWRSCYAAFCLQHGRVAAEGQWYIDTYAREWDDYPDFIFLGFHVDGEICVMFAHGMPNGDVIGQNFREVAA